MFEFPADKCLQDLQTLDLECVACSCIPQLCDLPENCYTSNLNDTQISRRSWRGVYKHPIRAASVLIGNTPYGRSVVKQKMLHNLRRTRQIPPNLGEPVNDQPSNIELILGQELSNLRILRILVTPLSFRSLTGSKHYSKLKKRNKLKNIEDRWYGKKKFFPFIRTKPNI